LSRRAHHSPATSCPRPGGSPHTAHPVSNVSGDGPIKPVKQRLAFVITGPTLIAGGLWDLLPEASLLSLSAVVLGAIQLFAAWKLLEWD